MQCRGVSVSVSQDSTEKPHRHCKDAPRAGCRYRPRATLPERRDKVVSPGGNKAGTRQRHAHQKKRREGLSAACSCVTQELRHLRHHPEACQGSSGRGGCVRGGGHSAPDNSDTRDSPTLARPRANDIRSGAVYRQSPKRCSTWRKAAARVAVGQPARSAVASLPGGDNAPSVLRHPRRRGTS